MTARRARGGTGRLFKELGQARYGGTDAATKTFEKIERCRGCTRHISCSEESFLRRVKSAAYESSLYGRYCAAKVLQCTSPSLRKAWIESGLRWK